MSSLLTIFRVIIKRCLTTCMSLCMCMFIHTPVHSYLCFLFLRWFKLSLVLRESKVYNLEESTKRTRLRQLYSLITFFFRFPYWMSWEALHRSDKAPRFSLITGQSGHVQMFLGDLHVILKGRGGLRTSEIRGG